MLWNTFAVLRPEAVEPSDDLKIFPLVTMPVDQNLDDLKRDVASLFQYFGIASLEGVKGLFDKVLDTLTRKRVESLSERVKALCKTAKVLRKRVVSDEASNVNLLRVQFNNWLKNWEGKCRRCEKVGVIPMNQAMERFLVVEDFNEVFGFIKGRLAFGEERYSGCDRECSEESDIQEGEGKYLEQEITRTSDEQRSLTLRLLRGINETITRRAKYAGEIKSWH